MTGSSLIRRTRSSPASLYSSLPNMMLIDDYENEDEDEQPFDCYQVSPDQKDIPFDEWQDIRATTPSSSTTVPTCGFWSGLVDQVQEMWTHDEDGRLQKWDPSSAPQEPQRLSQSSQESSRTQKGQLSSIRFLSRSDNDADPPFAKHQKKKKPTSSSSALKRFVVHQNNHARDEGRNDEGLGRRAHTTTRTTLYGRDDNHEYDGDEEDDDDNDATAEVLFPEHSEQLKARIRYRKTKYKRMNLDCPLDTIQEEQDDDSFSYVRSSIRSIVQDMRRSSMGSSSQRHHVGRHIPYSNTASTYLRPKVVLGSSTRTNGKTGAARSNLRGRPPLQPSLQSQRVLVR